MKESNSETDHSEGIEDLPKDLTDSGVVDRVLALEQEMATTHRARGSLLVKVGIPAVLVLGALIATSFTLPMLVSERLIIVALGILIGVPSVAIAVLLWRGRLDRKRLQEEMERLLSHPR